MTGNENPRRRPGMSVMRRNEAIAGYIFMMPCCWASCS